MGRKERLTEGYFELRKQSIGLRREGWRWEFLPWHMTGKTAVRENSEGWKLLVYEVEGDLEACVVEPSGVSSTYS